MSSSALELIPCSVLHVLVTDLGPIVSRTIVSTSIERPSKVCDVRQVELASANTIEKQDFMRSWSLLKRLH